MKPLKSLMLALLIGACPVQYTLAQELTPEALVQALQKQAQPGFSGELRARVYRQNTNELSARIEVRFYDPLNYQLSFQEPSRLKGMVFALVNGVSSVHLPEQKLFLTNYVSHLAGESFGLKVVQDADLLRKNYQIRISKPILLNGRMAYAVEFVSRRTIKDFVSGKTYPLVPRRKIWFEVGSLQVLWENRYWDFLAPDGEWRDSDNPYRAVSFHDLSSLSPEQVAFSLGPPQDVSVLDMSGPEPHQALSYTSKAEAEAGEKITLRMPKELPEGFELRDIQVYRINEKAIQIMNFSDGLNRFTVLIHPDPKGLNELIQVDLDEFDQFVADKSFFTALTNHLPYNYYFLCCAKQAAMVFGDIVPMELEQIAKQLELE